MSALDEIQRLLGSISRAEKAELLQWIAQDLGDAMPGIESQPEVNGGEPSIVRTRIPVWTLVRAHQLSISDGTILQNYPTLHAEDLTNAWAYYRTHREEIDQQIRENEDA